MQTQYSETLWEKIMNGQNPWNEKGPFCGRKKGFRLLRVFLGSFGSLTGFGNKLAL